MSEVEQVAQEATPEQQARAAFDAAVRAAQEKAVQDIQQNMQIEIQMRNSSLSMAVNANAPGTDPVTITKTAAVFLEFLKKGEATNV
jgi:rRNA processing protein Krr1/Pno1